MSITHNQKTTWSSSGSSTSIAYTVSQSGSVEANLDETIDGLTDNEEFAISIPYATIQSIFLVSSQDATLATNGTNEVQLLTVTGTVGATDTFYLTFGGQNTSTIDLDTGTAAVVQSELEALSTIGAGNVSVSGAAGGPWTVTFQGALAHTNVAALTATIATVTGAGITITTPTPGVAASQTITLTAGVPIAWHADSAFANPITANITKMSFTVAGTATASVVVRSINT